MLNDIHLLSYMSTLTYQKRHNSFIPIDIRFSNIQVAFPIWVCEYILLNKVYEKEYYNYDNLKNPFVQ